VTRRRHVGSVNLYTCDIFTRAFRESHFVQVPLQFVNLLSFENYNGNLGAIGGDTMGMQVRTEVHASL
jgi:hypothetical protein